MSYKVSINGADWVNIKTFTFDKTNKEIPVNEENLKKYMIELIENQLWYITDYHISSRICRIVFVRRFND